MKEDDIQERTEQATPKKAQESKDKGLVARSKDFNTLVVLFFSCVAFVIFGENLGHDLLHLFQDCFTLDGMDIANDQFLKHYLKKAAISGFFMVSPIMVLILIGSIISVLVMGGWTFSLGSVAPNFERLDPIKGLMKIFSVNSLMELFKSVLKVVVVLAAGYVIYFVFFNKIMGINYLDLTPGVHESLHLMIYSFFILVAALIVISLFDVPYQMWNHQQQLMMTKQEVRDEYKETEGKPEVKSKIRKMQKMLAKRRMMAAIPQADVIITNPTHFAVALKYDSSTMKAPVVIAKGADLIAHRMIEIGNEHKIPIVSMPPLARSIFHFADIDDEIPQKLYMAVAQILAYVHQLKQYKRGKSVKPILPKECDIPADMVK